MFRFLLLGGVLLGGVALSMLSVVCSILPLWLRLRGCFSCRLWLWVAVLALWPCAALCVPLAALLPCVAFSSLSGAARSLRSLAGRALRVGNGPCGQPGSRSSWSPRPWGTGNPFRSARGPSSRLRPGPRPGANAVAARPSGLFAALRAASPSSAARRPRAPRRRLPAVPLPRAFSRWGLRPVGARVPPPAVRRLCACLSLGGARAGPPLAVGGYTALRAVPPGACLPLGGALGRAASSPRRRRWCSKKFFTNQKTGEVGAKHFPASFSMSQNVKSSSPKLWKCAGVRGVPAFS